MGGSQKESNPKFNVVLDSTLNAFRSLYAKAESGSFTGHGLLTILDQLLFTLDSLVDLEKNGDIALKPSAPEMKALYKARRDEVILDIALAKSDLLITELSDLRLTISDTAKMDELIESVSVRLSGLISGL